VDYQIRKATIADRKQIQALIGNSARHLSSEYSDEQIEAALKQIFGVDTSLIDDGTYFVAELEHELIGCGGWSRRRTLFGGDQFSERDCSVLDPESEPARIRAFFIHPNFARQGIARAILARCENEARDYGFRSLELMSTLPGIKLYEACGFERVRPVALELESATIDFVVMRKGL
jgi:N-acetylglutamate synthase-like GNAT family acetyltransferase